MAALNIDGTTIHSAVGWQHGRATADKLIALMRQCDVNRWNVVKRIVVEEFSMRSAGSLTCLMEKCMINSRLPVGGVQLILVLMLRS